MKTLFVGIGILAGILFLVVAGIYAALPAHSLPMFFPGYDATLVKHHYTHAAASFGLSFVCFIFAWMNSGKKKLSSK